MINQEEESLQTFVKLGLTYLQAKIYLALVKLGKNGSEVRRIAHTVAIARQDIYRIMPALERMGLIERVISLPTLYKPIEIEEAISILMKKKAEEFIDTQKSAKFVLDNFVTQQPEDYENQSQFRITSDRALFLKRVKEGIVQAQSSIDIIYGEDRLRSIVYYTMEDFEKAIARGVKVRAITRLDQDTILDKNIETLVKNPNFQIRIIKKEIPVGLVIFDEKEVKFRTTQNLVPTMWTNNQNVVKMIQIYFDSMWQ